MICKISVISEMQIVYVPSKRNKKGTYCSCSNQMFNYVPFIDRCHLKERDSLARLDAVPMQIQRIPYQKTRTLRQASHYAVESTISCRAFTLQYSQRDLLQSRLDLYRGAPVPICRFFVLHLRIFVRQLLKSTAMKRAIGRHPRRHSCA